MSNNLLRRLTMTDCSLDVAPPSDAISAERDFIEATSRLTTFSIRSPSGAGTITPMEIRNERNKLDLVRQVLETSDDAYKHPELILDLAYKLGFRNDASARIQVLSMLSSSAIRDDEFDLASTHCENMFKLSTKHGIEKDVVYRALVSLGEQSEYADIERRMTVLGQALELAPADRIPAILQVWRVVEDGQAKLSGAAKRRRIAGISDPSASLPSLAPTSISSSIGSLGASTEERVLGSRTAARAARLAMGFAGNTLNLRGIASNAMTPSSMTPSVRSEDGTTRSSDGEKSSFGAIFDGAGVKPGTAEAERVRQQARKALVRGVGWLLGADEDEIVGA